MIYTFDERLCAYSRKQDIAFHTIAGGQPHAAIKVTVTDAMVPSEESCDDAPPEAASKDISVTYHWNNKASRYMADSDALKRLSADNEKRF
ncbi:hypothetical protein RFM68_30645 [Mesorhizobium sp. MSK_1335]|uniref:Uncharacterized protein n=1 Tax=Mesorhizobium montanum TaxID=3072323 RepID=A0ABU4ZXS6_9HYPH|nr:hypothetical protein [Mesorhizobium sp. MSK_1335]MDX8528838.1 hypothetical protein [Mesorhizobium sp. MSK_1335]